MTDTVDTLKLLNLASLSLGNDDRWEHARAVDSVQLVLTVLLEKAQAAEDEIRRLHMLHGSHYDGKIGEPDLEVADELRDAIAQCKE